MFYADVDVLFDSFAVTFDAEPAVDEHLPASPYGAKPLVPAALMADMQTDRRRAAPSTTTSPV
jgi:hypothetical protein